MVQWLTTSLGYLEVRVPTLLQAVFFVRQLHLWLELGLPLSNCIDMDIRK